MAALERQTGNFTVTKSRWLGWLLFLALGAGLVVLAFHFDEAARSWIAAHQDRSVKIFMRSVSRLGDWPAHVALGLLGLGIAWLRGNGKWMRIFLAMLLACALAGLAARTLKIATGRARPSVKSEQVWNGPRFGSKYNAFPSGHTAASTAFFVTLVLASWRIGLATLAVPLLIATSRMYVAAHYLSDVVFAALLGALCALVMANWLKTARES